MNDRKLRKLFEAARSEPQPTPSADFAAEALRAIRRGRWPQPPSLFDELNALFPRLAWSAAVVIALCVAVDLLIPTTSLSEDVAQVSEQWLFADNGL